MPTQHSGQDMAYVLGYHHTPFGLRFNQLGFEFSSATRSFKPET